MIGILFNGPPMSGKDEIGNAVARRLQARVEKFSKPLKQFHKFVLGKEYERGGSTFGVDDRQISIMLSEDFMKPRFGQTIFTRMLAERIGDLPEKWQARFCVITDCGFNAEVKAIKGLGVFEKLIVIRLRRDGTSFRGDSREWIDFADNVFDVDNNGTVEAAVQAVLDLLGVKADAAPNVVSIR